MSLVVRARYRLLRCEDGGQVTIHEGSTGKSVQDLREEVTQRNPLNNIVFSEYQYARHDHPEGTCSVRYVLEIKNALGNWEHVVGYPCPVAYSPTDTSQDDHSSV